MQTFTKIWRKVYYILIFLLTYESTTVLSFNYDANISFKSQFPSDKNLGGIESLGSFYWYTSGITYEVLELCPSTCKHIIYIHDKSSSYYIASISFEAMY